ncbi:BTB domain-containing protein [Mycena venus]|uniref:BTB domain-containing protein n=1 Tax=Mycena venus TaxID=2733690 RepID=A0A8H6YPA5_9AGAR|nr:BTB domain-containing protein [Mycena venus]
MSDSDSDLTTAPSSPRFITRSPFDDGGAGADVILRSSDGIDFHVHRLVLSLASSVFKDMFAFPQPDSDPVIPTVQVSESARILDLVLRFWYPGAEPTVVQTLDDLRETLEALIMKYDVKFVVPSAKKKLREHLADDPVAVFSIACRLQWKDVALEAAKESLKLPLRAFESERPRQLQYMTAETYHTLLQYHSECAKVAASATAALQWANCQDIPGVNCTNWADPIACPRTGHWTFAHNTMAPLTAWFSAYLDGATGVLSRSPAARLDSVDLLSLPLTKLGSCSSCRVDGFLELMNFLEILRAKIDGDINSIELKLDI